MLVNLQLLVSLVLVKATNNGVAGSFADSKVVNTPITERSQCTSRKLRISTLVDNDGIIEDYVNLNITEDTEGSENDAESDSFAPFCPEGYFCEMTADFTEDLVALCRPCPGKSESCKPVPAMTDGLLEDDLVAYAFEKAASEECQDQCAPARNACTSIDDCPRDLFCNFENGEDGYCEACPLHIYFCGQGKNLTGTPLDSCESVCGIQCKPLATLAISNPTTDSVRFMNDVSGMQSAPQLSASGPIVDCGLGLKTCEGVEDSVCFIERGQAPFANKTRNCQAGGGVAAVIYNVEAKCDNIDGTFFGVDTYIPTITLKHVDGKAILKEAAAMPPDEPMVATVEAGGPDVLPVQCVLGCSANHSCENDFTCNFDNGDFGDCRIEKAQLACNNAATAGTKWLKCPENAFCDYSQGKRGFCNECPRVPEECFFSNLNNEGAQECNTLCTGGTSEKIKSKPCKFCPKGSFDIGDFPDGFYSTQEEEKESPCEFCASSNDNESTCANVDRWDMEYPYRTIELFGTNVSCWTVAEFYRSMNLDANSTKCNSARSLNYICGCSDSAGYAGANSETKQIALVWFPRVGAILSILGSTLLIMSVLQDEQKKKKVIGELIIFLCAFDIVGSIGYAFASLPTPKDDYIYGSKGNEASCTAQGFFIQFGTISLYLNVSIAFYYLLIIQFSWREHRLRKSWFYHMLFVVPIVIGSIFAFAGIPFYDSAVTWCNNSRAYWSEIPVAVAIFIATVIMINLCWFVYKSERASRRFRRHSQEERASLSTAFFKQSLVYLGAFYLTWPPYLALQIMIAEGRAFTNYPFFIFAATAVTLQGFWNYTFHTGLHTRAIGRGLSRAWTKARSSSIAFVQGRSTFAGKFSDENVSSARNASSVRTKDNASTARNSVES